MICIFISWSDILINHMQITGIFLALNDFLIIHYVSFTNRQTVISKNKHQQKKKSLRTRPQRHWRVKLRIGTHAKKTPTCEHALQTRSHQGYITSDRSPPSYFDKLIT